MRTRGKTLAVLGLALTVLVPATARGHGGEYRHGPPSEVPPDSRCPGDPPPPTTPGGSAAPVTTPAFAGRAPSGTKATPWSDWKMWWGHNQDEILALRAARRTRTVRSGGLSRPHGTAIAVCDETIRTRIAPPLRKLLADPEQSFHIRSAAAIALARAGDASIEEDLRRILADDGEVEHREVRETAALALGLLGDAGRGSRGFLEDFVLGDRDDSYARPFAAISLGLLGDDDGSASDALVRVIARPEPHGDVKPACLLALGLLGGDRTIESLVAITRHGRAPEAGSVELNEIERSYAVAALGMIGEPGERDAALDAIEDLVRGGGEAPGIDVRRSAVIALGRIGARCDPVRRARAIDLLRDVADDGRVEEQARLFALTSLGRVGAGAAGDRRAGAEIAAFLGRTMRTGEGMVPSYSAMALGLVGRACAESGGPAPERDVRAPLREALANDRSIALRGAAAVACGMSRDPLAFDPLLDVVRDEHANAPLRGWCALALGMIGDARASDAVRNLMQEVNDRDLRIHCATAIGLLGDDTGVSDLLGLLREPDASNYELGSAALALGRIGDERAIDALVAIATDAKDAYPNLTRALAVVALGQIGDRRDVPLLARVATDVNYRARVPAIAELLTIL